MGRGIAFLLVLLLLPMAYALTEEQALPILAANMELLVEGDYALNCGPTDIHDTVLNTINADLKGKYCVLKDQQLIFGAVTVGGPNADVETLLRQMIATYSRYNPHVSTVPANLCDGAEENFERCGVIDGGANADVHLYAYAENAPEGVTVYLLASDEEINRFEESFFENIGGFLAQFFGLDDPEEEFLAQHPEYRSFHHAYFAKQNEHGIIGVWQDRTAIITYQGFGHDFAITYPARELGANSQRVSLSLSRTTPADVKQWRRLTSGIIIGDPVDEEDQVGAVCGDGIVNFDEQCDKTNLDDQQCATIGFGGGTLGCSSNCQFVTTACTCTDIDGDKFNLSGAGCGALFDCNDTNSSFYPGAIDWCGNGMAENCSIANWQSYAGRDGPNCRPVPPPALVCNFNGTCDAGEAANCRDCIDDETACPTPMEQIEEQGEYTISVRAGVNNTPELIIATTNISCELTQDRYTIIKGPGQSSQVIFEDTAGHQIILTTSPLNWSLTGNASASDTGVQLLKNCWGTDNRDGRDLGIIIPMNDVPACTAVETGCAGFGRGCGIDADCCQYGVTDTWCGEQNTCERDFRPICDDVEGQFCRLRDFIPIID